MIVISPLPLVEVGLTDLLDSGVHHAPLWARIAQNVKKSSQTEHFLDFEFFGFNVSIWVPWSSLGLKKSRYIGIILIHQICIEKQGAFCLISKISLKSLYSVS